MADTVPTRHEYHAHRRDSRNFAGIVYGTAGQVATRQAGGARCLADGGLNRRITERGRDVVDHGTLSCNPLLGVRLPELLLNEPRHPLDFHCVEIAELEGELNTA